MLTIRSTFSLVAFSSALALAQRNVTVPNSDPRITYGGQPLRDALICQYDSNGMVSPGQPGCFNFGRDQCTDSLTMAPTTDGAATFSFNGSAIYITSARYVFSPLYTVTLDEQTEDVDGFLDKDRLSCDNLFTRTGLDSNVEHTITLAYKGRSPQDNTTGDPWFSLINFIYTEGEEDSTSAPGNASSTADAGPSASVNGSEPASSSDPAEASDDGAGVALFAARLSVALGSMLGLVAALL